MAIPFFIDKRHLIPNWRSFKSTLNRGELGANTEFFKSIHVDDIFEKRKDAWREHRALLTATELLGAAIMFDINDCPEVTEAASYIEYNALSSSSSMLSVAGRFHHPENIGKSSAIKALDSFEEFDEMQLKSKIYSKIRRVKNDLIDFPRNAIQWVELARYYSTIGVIEKAKIAMKIALSLASENRFVLRAYTRLFVHTKDFDLAHDALRKSTLVTCDPWITSAEIAVSSLRERTSRHIVTGRNMLASKKFSPLSLTELSSSIATLELENGSMKKSRHFFEQSLIAPNDNSLAQAEWATRKESKLNLIIPDNLLKSSYEGAAYLAYHNNDWKGVIENCMRWFIDMPHSKTSLVIAHHVSVIFLKDFELGIKLCNAALISHPNDTLVLNNLAYDYAMLNRTAEAMLEIQKAEAISESNRLDSVCLLATKGLVYFRMQQVEQGRYYYMEAMKEAKKANHQYYIKLALLNACREELISKTIEAQIFLEQVKKMQLEPEQKDLVQLKSEVLKMSGNSATVAYPS